MNAVGARLDPNVYDRAVLPAIFRLGILLGTELLDGVDGHEGARISAAGTRYSRELRPALSAIPAIPSTRNMSLCVTPSVGARRCLCRLPPQ